MFKRLEELFEKHKNEENFDTDEFSLAKKLLFEKLKYGNFEINSKSKRAKSCDKILVNQIINAENKMQKDLYV